MTPAEISSSADYPAHMRTFQREQSRTLRQMEWEHRAPALRAWRSDIAAAIGIVLLGILAFPVAEILVDLLGR